MSQPARLTSTLLVRKGTAQPTPGFASPSSPNRALPRSATAPAVTLASMSLSPTSRSPAQPGPSGRQPTSVSAVMDAPVLTSALHQASADERPSLPGPIREPAARRPKPAPATARVALTLRLDPVQHKRLRVYAALNNCTKQEAMMRGLDQLLSACGDQCACVRGNGPCTSRPKPNG